MATMDAPSAERNKEPIWIILRDFVFQPLMDACHERQDPITTPKTNTIRVLEVAAGAGVHTSYLSHHLDQLLNTINSDKVCLRFEWIPTDPDVTCRHSIQERLRQGVSLLHQGQIRTPISLTLDEKGIQENINLRDFSQMECILCINMIHIAPWEATIGLLKMSHEILSPQHGLLCLYGPFLRNGTAEDSNLAFDRSLRERNSAWGLRHLEDIQRVASDHGLFLQHIIEMPANNLLVIFCHCHSY